MSYTLGQSRFYAKKDGRYYYVADRQYSLVDRSTPFVNRQTAQKYADCANNEARRREFQS